MRYAIDTARCARATCTFLRRRSNCAQRPFGTGPRVCIGRQLALHEILLTLTAILHHYDLEPRPAQLSLLGFRNHGAHTRRSTSSATPPIGLNRRSEQQYLRAPDV
ncbi:cytochrome P450 [Mycobacterium haemophilum]|uniref:cytochrome P450 n=1 Tax=Mycobacterium haemophilum TaxID=29311 RepID=UPI0012E0C0F2